MHDQSALYNDFFLSTDATIGFMNTNLNVFEDGGELEFEIAVLDGDLCYDVLVNFLTDNGAALGIQQFIRDCNFCI